MCGIAGVYHLNNKDKVDTLRLKKMSDIIHYRGPDGDGQWVNDNCNVGLAHRRLAIIDLMETGKQPMHYLNNRYTITYNGEIYNYKEIKAALVLKGYQFSSTSDTEVLLALYDSKGTDCLSDLDGMFAFAIYDQQESTLFCARDRFGEKPFHYYFNDDVFIFGSEIKQIFQYKTGFTIDIPLLQVFFNTGQIALDEQTYFKEIKALAPAHSILIKDEKIAINKYWDIDLNRKINFASEKEYIEVFREKFFLSISRRLRSDVPFGSCLSGGIDSSSIVSAISNIESNAFTTLSARFNDEAKDEGKWIKEVVNKTGVRNTEVYPDPKKLLDEISELLYHHEFPIASSSQYAQWCVYRLAADNSIKVLLDGQGADEYLGGYDHLKYYAIWQFYRDFKWIKFLQERKYLHKNWDNKSNTGLLFLLDPLLNLVGKRREIFERGYTFKERLKFSVLHELGELLRYGDRSSMAFSVEVRLPFLNHDLVEFAMSVPDEMIYKKGVTKYILRKSVEGVIPDAIFNRYDKLGFAPPQKKWIADSSYLVANKNAIDFLSAYSLVSSEDIFRNIVVEKVLKVFTNFETNGKT